MMESPQSKDPQKADPLADALERLERSVANREKARIASLVDSGSETREKESFNVTEECESSCKQQHPNDHTSCG